MNQGFDLGSEKSRDFKALASNFNFFCDSELRQENFKGKNM